MRRKSVERMQSALCSECQRLSDIRKVSTACPRHDYRVRYCDSCSVELGTMSLAAWREDPRCEDCQERVDQALGARL